MQRRWLSCNPQGSFGCSKSPRGKGTFVPLPPSKPQQPQQINLTLRQQYLGGKSTMIHAGGPGSGSPSLSFGYSVHQHCQSRARSAHHSPLTPAPNVPGLVDILPSSGTCKKVLDFLPAQQLLALLQSTLLQKHIQAEYSFRQ